MKIASVIAKNALLSLVPPPLHSVDKMAWICCPVIQHWGEEAILLLCQVEVEDYLVLPVFLSLSQYILSKIVGRPTSKFLIKQVAQEDPHSYQFTSIPLGINGVMGNSQ